MSRSKNRRRKKGKARNIAFDAMIVVVVAIIGISGFMIYQIEHNYKHDKDSYKKINSEVRDEEEGFTGDIDWTKLREINSDVVGWLYLEDSNIDYPIVQSRDNDEYLHTLFDGNAGAAGSIFVDAGTLNPFGQFNTVVYGHHMKDGSMFADLRKFKDMDYAKSHGRFELITPGTKYHLDIYAFLNCPADSEVYRCNVEDEDRDDYLNTINNSAEYTTNMAIGEDDKLVVLSTCAYEYDDARYVIVGKLTPWS